MSFIQYHPLIRAQMKTHQRTFKGHVMEISRRVGYSAGGGGCLDWYIQVWTPGGFLCYDGYWADSVGKSVNEAFAEAKAGSLLS